MTRVYLDVCCWNRPFDNQTQARIHLEAEAVLAIMTDIEIGVCELVHSEIADLEISESPDSERRQRLQLMIPRRHRYFRCDAKVVARGLELERLGFPDVDALHIACAEAGGASVFLTTDDRLLRVARRCSTGSLHVEVANPLAWVQDTHGERA
jgi:predicted nucleic acid-binding protein